MNSICVSLNIIALVYHDCCSYRSVANIVVPMALCSIRTTSYHTFAFKVTAHAVPILPLVLLIGIQCY